MLKKIIIILLLAIAALVLYLSYGQSDKDNTIYGFVYSDVAKLSFRQAGRVSSIYVQEGQAVTKDFKLASIDLKPLEFEHKNIQAQCAQAQAELDLLQHGYEQESIDEACYNAKALSNEYELSNRTYKRYSVLHQKDQISEQKYDEARLQRNRLANLLAAAKARCQQLKDGYRKEQIVQAEQKLAQCQAREQSINYSLNEEAMIKAPFAGFVRAKYIEQGDSVSPAVIAFELSKAHSLKARVYVSEHNLVKLKLNQEVRISNEAKQSFKGKIIYIADKAMFTPKNVITEELRGLLVYEVKIALEDNDVLRDGQSISLHLDE